MTLTKRIDLISEKFNFNPRSKTSDVTGRAIEETAALVMPTIPDREENK